MDECHILINSGFLLQVHDVICSVVWGYLDSCCIIPCIYQSGAEFFHFGNLKKYLPKKWSYLYSVFHISNMWRTCNQSFWTVSWGIAMKLRPLASVLSMRFMNKGWQLALCVCVYVCVRFFMSVRWELSCRFSRSRGQGWEGRSASPAEATGNCSTCYRQHNKPCSRACDHLPLEVDLLPERGLGEYLSWPGHQDQEPSHRWAGEPAASNREGWGRLILGWDMKLFPRDTTVISRRRV